MITVLPLDGPGLRWVQGSGRFFQGDASDWWSDDAAVNDRLSPAVRSSSLDIGKAKLMPVTPLARRTASSAT